MSDYFRENLRQAISESGLFIKEIAAESGVKKRTIDKWVGSNPTIPSAIDAVNVARVLKTTVEYLVTGEEPLLILPADRRLLEKARRYRTLMEALDDLQVDVRNTFITAIVQTAEVCRKQHAANTANA